MASLCRTYVLFHYIIRPIVSLLTVHNIIHINVQHPESKNIINKRMQCDANHTVKEPQIFSFPSFPAGLIIVPYYFADVVFVHITVP